MKVDRLPNSDRTSHLRLLGSIVPRPHWMKLRFISNQRQEFSADPVAAIRIRLAPANNAFNREASSGRAGVHSALCTLHLFYFASPAAATISFSVDTVL